MEGNLSENDSSSSSSSDSVNVEEALELETVSVNSSNSSSSSGSESSVYSQSNHFAPFRSVVNTRAIPNTIDRARNELSLIFDRTNWHNASGQQWVRSLLSAFPALASEAFEDSYDEWRWPLSHLLTARAPLEIIQEVYHLYPAAIAQRQGSHNDTPAHDACWYGNDTDVIRFIVTEYPEALTQRNDYRRLPIHDALRSSRISKSGRWAEHTPLETLRFLLQLYPEWVKDNDEKNYLESAFSYDYNVETLEFLAHQWPAPQLEDTFQLASNRSITLDLPKTKVLVKILPHLRKMRLDASSWTLDGFVHLFKSLQDNNNNNNNNIALEMLEILEFPAELLAHYESARKAFENFLKHNTSLQMLCLSFPPIINRLENVNDVCLKGLAQGLGHNQTLKRVVLKRMLLTNDTILSTLLTSATAPQSLILEQIGFSQQPSNDSSPRSDNNNNNNNNHGGKIESIRFVDCIIPSIGFVNLIHRITHMPSLKRLHIGIGPSVPGVSAIVDTDLTEPLTLLLQRAMEEVCVSAVYKVNVEPLCEALKTNKSLHTLLIPSAFQKTPSNLVLLEEVLASHNCTLQECGVKPAGRHDRVRDKVVLWTRLNRFGRGRARAEGTTLDELIKDLSTVRDDTSLKLVLDKVNLHYGLLRACPYLWCGQESFTT